MICRRSLPLVTILLFCKSVVLCSCFFPPAFEAQRYFPLLLLIFVSCLSYYSANTCNHSGTLSRFKLVPLSSHKTKLSILFHFILVYSISFFYTALNCALRNSKSLFNVLAKSLSELKINFAKLLFVSLNFALL